MQGKPRELSKKGRKFSDADNNYISKDNAHLIFAVRSVFGRGALPLTLRLSNKPAASNPSTRILALATALEGVGPLRLQRSMPFPQLASLDAFVLNGDPVRSVGLFVFQNRRRAANSNAAYYIYADP